MAFVLGIVLLFILGLVALKVVVGLLAMAVKLALVAIFCMGVVACGRVLLKR